MADYYPLIAKAVTGLEKSTGEARRALYDRARSVLVAQLRGVTPALTRIGRRGMLIFLPLYASGHKHTRSSLWGGVNL